MNPALAPSRDPASLRLAAARALASERMPYLSAALFAIMPVRSELVPTLAVDRRWRLYWNPTWCMTISVEELAGGWLHEVGHLIREHRGRFVALLEPASRAYVFNIAGDAAINTDLVAGGVRLPPDGVMMQQIPGGVAGMTTEQLYWLLISASTENDETPDCGSGATAGRRPWDIDDGEFEDDGSVDSERATLVRRQVAHDIREYQKSSMAGDLPAGLRRWADEILEPRVNWRAELESVLRRKIATIAGVRDYTYARPSRRASTAPDVVLPAMRQPGPPEVFAVVDTSGSMSSSMLGQCLGEIEGLVRRVGGPRGGGRSGVRVVSCDVQAGVVQRVRSARDIKLTGGGGTDLRSCIRGVARARPRADLIVVLTDGDTPWDDQPPRENVSAKYVVVLVDGPRDTIPPWLKTIIVDDGPRE